MSISIERYINHITQAQVVKLTCGFETIEYLLGDWIVYNDLIKYKKDDIIDLAIGTKVYDDIKLVITVWINNEFIKDIELKNYGSDLIYKMEQIDWNEIIST